MKISVNFKVGKRKFSFNNESPVIEYYLLDFNEDMEAAWIHILSIYKEILHSDDKWHFFYEGTYSIIRCQQKYQKKLERYLENNDIEFRCRGEWLGDHWAVCKYQDHFTRMFHDFSLLAIKMEEKDLIHVADRIIHPFFNHCVYMAEDIRKLYGNASWESTMMAHLTVSRAMFAGQMIQLDKQRKKEQKEKENVEDNGDEKQQENNV